MHQRQAGEEARRHSLVTEQKLQVGEQQQQQQSKSEQRRHSLGLVMTSRPSSEWEPPGRELPTILESPGVKPYVALHISESPSRPLTDLESALQKLEDGGKPLQDFDSALDGYRSSQLSRGCGSFGILDSQNVKSREGKARPVSALATVGRKFDGQYRAEKYFEGCNNFERLEGGSNMGAGKYFDNLVAMIEGSMRGLEL